MSEPREPKDEAPEAPRAPSEEAAGSVEEAARAAAEEREQSAEGEAPGERERAEASEPDERAGEAAEKARAARPPIRVRLFGRTDVGLVREHNEDNFLVADLDDGERHPPLEEVFSFEVGPHGAIFAVCDGMGGANAGEVASQMAVDTLFEVMRGWDEPADRDVFAHRLVKAVEVAGERIFAAAKMDPELRGMGTTATVAGLVDDVLFVGQVGDSRAYVLRGEDLGLVTKDQSLVNQLIEAGQLSEEDAESFELGNIILQALGTTESVNVDLSFLKLRRGDRLMLCSDGLSGLVHDDVLRETLRDVEDPKACCERLVEMANAGGGHDNITVIVVDFDGEGLEEPDPEAKPIYSQYPLPVIEDPTPVHRARRRKPSEKLAERRPGEEPRAEAAPDSGRPPAETVRLGEPRGSRAPWAVGAVLIAGGVLLATRFVGGEAAEEPARVADDGAEAHGEVAVAPRAEEVDVRVRVDEPRAEVLVDGRSFGLVREGEARFKLPPGVYRVSARVGQDMVAETRVRVAAPGPVVVELATPEGREPDEPAVDVDAAAGAAAEPAPTTGSGAKAAGAGSQGGSEPGAGSERPGGAAVPNNGTGRPARPTTEAASSSGGRPGGARRRPEAGGAGSGRGSRPRPGSAPPEEPAPELPENPF